MSHVAVQETKPGQPMFKDMEALKMACDMLGLEIVKRKTYAWYNRHMGDYPLPKGVKPEELGKNAEFVIKMNAEMTAKHRITTTTEPYEIGMLADQNNEGCFVPIYDFYNKGYGLEGVIGRPRFNDSAQTSVEILCPKLKQHYDMCCDALAARMVGDKIEFLTAKQAHEKYPQLFPAPTEDEETWVSIANTDNRVEATLT